MTANIVLLCALSGPLGLSNPDMSTLAVVLTCLTGFIMLFKVSTPFNGLRGRPVRGAAGRPLWRRCCSCGEFFALTNLDPAHAHRPGAHAAVRHRADAGPRSTWWTTSSPTAQSPLRQLGKRKGRRRKA